jgi:hypothetical protein
MFVLKGLGRMIWGDPDKTEIVQIPSGQLYLVRPKNSVKGTSECMYSPLLALSFPLLRSPDKLSMLDSKTRPHPFDEQQQNSTINWSSREPTRRVKSNSTKTKMESSEMVGLPPPHPRSASLFTTCLGPKDERATLLDESLHFRSTLVDGTVVLAWRDLSGDPGDVYKFICDPTTPPGVSHAFELVGTLPPYSHISLLTNC